MFRVVIKANLLMVENIPGPLKMVSTYFDNISNTKAQAKLRAMNDRIVSNHC